MKLVESGDRSDGYYWECRKQVNGKWHRCERSIREGRWFEGANLTIEEVLKFTYWWCQDLNQLQIKQQLQLGSHTTVDWDMFCQGVCEVALFDGREKIGRPGKFVQIDESQIGKRNYHRGHACCGGSVGFRWHRGRFTQVFYCDSRGPKGGNFAKSDQTMD